MLLSHVVITTHTHTNPHRSAGRLTSVERQVIDLLGERFKLEPGTSESHDEQNSYIFMLANVCVAGPRPQQNLLAA